MRDQITSDRQPKHAWSKYVQCIPYIFSGRPNDCWLHTCDTGVTTTWRLGFQAPLVACKNWLTEEEFYMIVYRAYACICSLTATCCITCTERDTRYLVTIKQEDDMNMCSCPTVILILRFQKKSEPKPSYMYQRSWSDQIAVSVNQLHHQLQTMVNNALEYCPPWISCSKQTDHPWKMKHVCINSTKILVISCMT